MSALRNKYLAMRYFQEIMVGANIATMYELVAPECVLTLPTYPHTYSGPDGCRDLVSMLHGCFPDYFIHLNDMVASGDTVVTRWRSGGTHLGATFTSVGGSIPASGRSFEIDGMTWLRMAGGQIVEAIGHEDTAGMFTQLGVIPSASSATTPEQNLATAHRYFDEVMNQGKLRVIEEIMAPGIQFIIPTQPEPITGYGNMGGFVGYLRNAFPDIHFAVEREIAVDNKVAVRWSITGTHAGEFLGKPPTGNAIEDFGIDIFTFEDGKIRAVHVSENDFGLFQQLEPRK